MNVLTEEDWQANQAKEFRAGKFSRTHSQQGFSS